VLNAAQLQWNRAILIEEGDDGFLFVQREGDFVANISGLDGSGRQDQQHARRPGDRLFDRAVPSLTGVDVELVHPLACPGFRSAANLSAKSESTPAVAEERGWCLGWHGRSPKPRRLPQPVRAIRAAGVPWDWHMVGRNRSLAMRIAGCRSVGDARLQGSHPPVIPVTAGGSLPSQNGRRGGVCQS